MTAPTHTPRLELRTANGSRVTLTDVGGRVLLSASQVDAAGGRWTSVRLSDEQLRDIAEWAAGQRDGPPR